MFRPLPCRLLACGPQPLPGRPGADRSLPGGPNALQPLTGLRPESGSRIHTSLRDDGSTAHAPSRS